MTFKIPDWFTKSISIGPKTYRPPSRWERQIGKAMHILAVLGLLGFVIWRTHLHYRVTQQFDAIRSAGLIMLAALPPSASLVMTNITQQHSETAQQRGCFFSSLDAPALARVIIKDATTLAPIRLAQTGLVLECYRAQHGQLPKNPAELTPVFLSVVPADPYTGEPLRYRRTEKGCVIYSVDHDGHDAGGREKPLNAKHSDLIPSDITFIVER